MTHVKVKVIENPGTEPELIFTINDVVTDLVDIPQSNKYKFVLFSLEGSNYRFSPLPISLRKAQPSSGCDSDDWNWTKKKFQSFDEQNFIIRYLRGNKLRERFFNLHVMSLDGSVDIYLDPKIRNGFPDPADNLDSIDDSKRRLVIGVIALFSFGLGFAFSRFW